MPRSRFLHQYRSAIIFATYVGFGRGLRRDGEEEEEEEDDDGGEGGGAEDFANGNQGESRSPARGVRKGGVLVGEC
jgi:hypothetical protein